MDMDSSSDEIQQASQQLAFLAQKNWLGELVAKSDQESADFYQQQLIAATEGMGYCIDERPLAEADPLKNRAPKPAFVGGAAGWIVMYLLAGKSLPQAINLIKQLYEKMNWGEMEIHTDDHSHEGQVGCGFLNVQQKVIEVLKALKIPGVAEVIDQNASMTIFNALKDTGAQVVTLTDKHKADVAKVVINQTQGKTLDRQALYEQHPVFLWDAWATVSDQVRAAYNELAGTTLETNDFFRIQAGLHLATGMFLNAVRLEGSQKNVVLVQ